MQQDIVSLRNRAVSLLANREHSRKELVNKLGKRAASESDLYEVLDQLQERGLQSDERFAEMFVRSRINRGQGPVRIQQELRLRGVANELLAQSIRNADVDWFELAAAQRIKRFGHSLPEDHKSYAKQLRFLLYRGFNQDQARHAMEFLAPESDY